MSDQTCQICQRNEPAIARVALDTSRLACEDCVEFLDEMGGPDDIQLLNDARDSVRQQT